MEIVKEPASIESKATTPKNHEDKMLYKERRRLMWWKSTSTDPLVLANISKHHPDYGMSPKEHEHAKMCR